MYPNHGQLIGNTTISSDDYVLGPGKKQRPFGEISSPEIGHHVVLVSFRSFKDLLQQAFGSPNIHVGTVNCFSSVLRRARVDARLKFASC